MSPERQYNEDEVAAIFKQATADQKSAQPQLPPGGGLLLAELEEIGKEAGITPEYIARAAASLDRIGPIPSPAKAFGVPISVARTVELPGPLSDQAWHRLVADLRETFQATGEVRQEGGTAAVAKRKPACAHRANRLRPPPQPRDPEWQRSQRVAWRPCLFRHQPGVYVDCGNVCGDGSGNVVGGSAECDGTVEHGRRRLPAAALERGARATDGSDCRASDRTCRRAGSASCHLNA